MKHNARSAMATGVTMLAVSAAVIAPVRPAPPQAAEPAVRLVMAAHATQLPPLVRLRTDQSNSSVMLLGPSAAAVDLPGLLVDWLERIIVPPSVGAAFPEPHFQAAVGGTSIDSVIKDVYNAIEPWVEWGFDVAAYAVGWIPWVGWLAPQIEIFYNFGERIVRSITFNIADWVGGNISFWDGLVNVGIDTINSFISLANDELAFWLPPLPPIPPIGPFAVEAEDTESMMAFSFDESTPLIEPLGEKPIQTEGVTEGQVVGELVDGNPGELLDNEKEQIEEVVNTEETTPDLTIDELTDRNEPEEAVNPTTTNSLGTVQAQGEIRASTFASPTGPSLNAQSTDGSRNGVLNQEPTELEQAPSLQESPTNEDGAQNTGNVEGDPGEGNAAE